MELPELRGEVPRRGESRVLRDLGDRLVGGTEVGAPTTPRGFRRRVVYDSSAKTYSLVTAGYTNFTVTASTSISRRFERSIRLGANTDGPPKSYSPLRICGLNIYEGSDLLHDFQPKVVNGVPGHSAMEPTTEKHDGPLDS